MKAVILAGGMGTRLSEETTVRPKPMVEIGGRPILWHILKIYSQHGINDFIICCGYKGYLIKEYFANYFLHTSDVTFDIGTKDDRAGLHHRTLEVTLVDTGDHAGTGGRLRRVAKYLEGEESFCMTYGDGLSDIDIPATIAFHKAHGKLHPDRVQPLARFGRWSSRTPGSTPFRKSPRMKAGGSMAASSSSRPRSSMRSRTTARCSSTNRSRRCRPRRGSGLLPSRLLAGHGHPARQTAARRTMAIRQSPLEVLVAKQRYNTDLHRQAPIRNDRKSFFSAIHGTHYRSLFVFISP